MSENVGLVPEVEKLASTFRRELDYLEPAGSLDLELETPIAARFVLGPFREHRRLEHLRLFRVRRCAAHP